MGLEVLAMAAIASSTYQSYSMDKAQQKSLRRQRTAQQQAQNAALKQERVNEESIARANRKTPDVAALLAESQELKGSGTILTGPGGIPSTNLLGL